jgi:hypothetical protein
MKAPRRKPFSRQAAILSWVCPSITIIIFVVLIFSGQIVPRRIIALVASGALGLIGVGLVFGIGALFGVSKYGKKGILAPAIVGIIMNGLLLSFVVTNLIRGKAGATRQHSGNGELQRSDILAVEAPTEIHR